MSASKKGKSLCRYWVDFIAFTSSIIAILTLSKAIIQSCMGVSSWFAKGTKTLVDTQLLCNFGEDQILNGASIVFTSSIIRISTIRIKLVCERNRALMDIKLLYKFD